MHSATKVDRALQMSEPSRATALREYGIALGVTMLVTLVCVIIEPFTGNTSIALLYLLSVVAAGIKLNRGPVLLVAANSALIWNFLFLPPRFALLINDPEESIMFAMFFIVALAMGHLTSRLRQNELAERNGRKRIAALYELVQQAGLVADLDSGLRAAIRLTESFFGVQTALLLRLPDHSLAAAPHSASSYCLDAKEYQVAAWAFSHRKPAGRFTETFSDSQALHLPLDGGSAVMGSLAVHPLPQTIIGIAEKELLQTFAVLIGAIVEKDELLQVAKRAEIVATTERLERALLRSVSHELKTPLSVVGAGIDALAKLVTPDARIQSTLREIHHGRQRLNRVINNLLHMMRIESGGVRPQLDWCDVGDTVDAAKDLAGEIVTSHRVTVDLDLGGRLVRSDQHLLEQCLHNLLLNAAANSAPASEINIIARVTDVELIISVRDEGKGVADAELPHIFQAFYRGAAARAGGTGLGLAIVDGFVRALGGSVSVANKPPQGAEFIMSIPAETLRTDALEQLA